MSSFAEILAATALTARRRAPARGRFLFYAGLVLTLLAAAAAGVFLDRIVRRVSPVAGVRDVLASRALIFYAAFFVLRMVRHETAVAPVKPLLLLPFRRSTLAAARMAAQLVHVTNLVVIPFTVCAVYVHLAPASASAGTRIAYAAGAILLLATLDWAAQLVSAMIVARAWMLLLLVLPLLVLAVAVPNAAQLVFGISSRVFAPERAGLLLLTSFLLTCGVAGLSFFHVRTSLYLDEARPSPRPARRPWGASAAPGARRTSSLAWTFVAYEMKLIARQPRTRQLMLLTTPAGWFLSGFFLLGGGHGRWNIFLASLAGLMLANAYGVRLFGWEGAHFTGLLAWPEHDLTYVRAKVTLLRMMIGVSLLPLCAAFFVPGQLFAAASFIVCYVVVCPYLLIVSGLWNRQYMETSRGILLNYQGVDLLEWGSLPLLAFIALEAGMTALLDARLLSLVNFAIAVAVLALESALDRLLAGQYAERKYALLHTFRTYTGDAA